MFWRLCALAALLLLLAADPALAARTQEVSEWRHTWDLIWKIINFLILAFVIVKFGRQPIKAFLSGQRDLVAMDLDEIEKLKEQARHEQKLLQAKIDSMAEELLQFEERMAQAAEKERDSLLEQAQRDCDLIIERAELWADQALKVAKTQLATEILDEAAEMATEKLKANINAEDNQRLFEDFTEHLANAS